MRRGLILASLAACCLSPVAARGQGTLVVRAKSKPDRQWREYPTRTLEHVTGFHPADRLIPLSRYGGRADRKMPACGFFRVRLVDGRWWLVDPEGCLFLHVGVVSVRPNLSAGSRLAFERRFGSEEKWAAAAGGLLGDHGFNGAGAWKIGRAHV